MDAEHSNSFLPQPSPIGPDDAGASESGVGVWTLLWTILIAKIATILLVVWAAHSFEAGALIGATMLPWLVAAVLVGASPLLFRYRLRRVRAKRDQLRHAEWTVEPVAGPAPNQADPTRLPR